MRVRGGGAVEYHQPGRNRECPNGWMDYIYLSRDGVFDGNELFLAARVMPPLPHPDKRSSGRWMFTCRTACPWSRIPLRAHRCVLRDLRGRGREQQPVATFGGIPDRPSARNGHCAGHPHRSSLLTTDEKDRYRISISQPARLYIDALAGNVNVNWKLARAGERAGGSGYFGQILTWPWRRATTS